MDAKIYLKEYSDQFKIFKDKFLKEKVNEASVVDSLAGQSLQILGDYMEGGKKARGALTVLGFKIAGGKDIAAIMPASFAIELVHSSILVHDDFVDNDEFRRGKPTIHEIYKNKRNNIHYGASMAVIVADLGLFWAHQIFSELNLSKDKIVKAIYEFDKLLLNTGYGELLDIDSDYNPNLGWNDILKIRIYKTAHYTFVMPLQIGAILAGANKNTLENLKKYGEPVGLAFQIQDDILGIFGDSDETGKSNVGDIREGKKTLLYFKALELAKKEDRQFLKKHYGKIKNEKEIDEIRRIIKESGALAYSQKIASDFVDKGKKVVPKITSDKEMQDTLISLADFIIERRK